MLIRIVELLEEITLNSNISKTLLCSLFNEKLSELLGQRIRPDKFELGAYRDKVNADKDWHKFSIEIPEVNKLSYQLVKAEVYGIDWYRLILKGNIGQLEQVCNRIKTKGYDCFLR